MKVTVSSRIALVAFFALAGAVSAQTLYKLVDKNGKVTYSETAPEKFDGVVTRIEVDSKANTMDAPKAGSSKGEQGKAETENERIIRRTTVTAWDKVKLARDNADATCKAYEDTRDNPGESDVTWIAVGATGRPRPPGAPVTPTPPSTPPKSPPTGPSSSPRKGTGARPVPTDEYIARVASLEKACQDAKEEVRVAERDVR